MRMRTAYLGIAEKNRLLAWWPEHPHLRRFLERRQARNPREICFWAVLPSEEASQVNDCLQLGELDAALRLLQQTDLEIGRILPPSAELYYQA